MKTEIQLIKPMYSCQNVPVVVFRNTCPAPCLYCGLSERIFPEDQILASGIDNVLKELPNYKSAYFSPTTDCFLEKNSDITHYLIQKTWEKNQVFTPLVITKQIIPQKTIDLFIKNKDRLVLQISVPAINQELISILEPGSALIQDRLNLIQQLTTADIPVIAVAMPWFPIDEYHSDLPEALAKVGIKKAIIATGILPEKQRDLILKSKNKKIKEIADWVEEYGKNGATKNGYTFKLGVRLVFLRMLVDLFNLNCIKAIICTSDNFDIIGKTSLPLCQKFIHHNFKD